MEDDTCPGGTVSVAAPARKPRAPYNKTPLLDHSRPPSLAWNRTNVSLGMLHIYLLPYKMIFVLFPIMVFLL